MLKVADKRRLLLAAGFEPPGSVRAPQFERAWFVPRAFCTELGTTGIDGLCTGKMLSFDEAWRRYERHETENTCPS